nr:hypothetical protein [Tanacetum cinerariifolium]
MLLLTWHDSSEPTKKPVCDSVTPRCMPHCMLTPPTDESVIVYTQLSGVQGVDTQDHVLPTIQSHFNDINPSFVSQQATASQVIEDVMRQLSFEKTKLDGEAGFGDVARSGIESYGLSHDESFGVYDLDLNLNEPVDEPIVKEVIVEDYVSSGEDAEQGNGQEDESALSDRHFFYDDEGIDSAYETQYDVHSSEDAGTYDDDDDDDEDDDFLVDEENEIVEPEVDVHLFGISVDVPFDNISVTNLVPNDVLEGDDVDAINANAFNSDPGNDNETSNYRRIRLAELGREIEGVINASGQWKYSFYTGKKFTTAKEAKDRIYLHSIRNRRNLKLYKNDSVRLNARCDGKVLVFIMSQGTGPTGPNHGMKAGSSGSSGPTTRSKKKKNTSSNDDNQAWAILGQGLAAVGVYSNNVIYQLAYALIESESRAKSDLLLNNICEVGRLKKKRKRSKHEDALFVKDGKLRKKERTITCQSCGNIGHNKATCKGQGKNNAEASDSASRKAQHAEPAFGHDGSTGSGVGDVIGLSVADCAGGGVGSQGSSHTIWTKRIVQTLRSSPQKTIPLNL